MFVWFFNPFFHFPPNRGLLQSSSTGSSQMLKGEAQDSEPLLPLQALPEGGGSLLSAQMSSKGSSRAGHTPAHQPP